MHLFAVCKTGAVSAEEISATYGIGPRGILAV